MRSECHSLSSVLQQTCAAGLVLVKGQIAIPHQGAGFAPLATTIVSSSAVYLDLLLQASALLKGSTDATDAYPALRNGSSAKLGSGKSGGTGTGGASNSNSNSGQRAAPAAPESRDEQGIVISMKRQRDGKLRLELEAPTTAAAVAAAGALGSGGSNAFVSSGASAARVAAASDALDHDAYVDVTRAGDDEDQGVAMVDDDGDADGDLFMVDTRGHRSGLGDDTDIDA